MTDDDLSKRLVDSINMSYGVHPGHRAAHAKGVLCAARLVPTSEAAQLSQAAHLGGGEIRAHVRFSNGSGDPTAHDGARDARGMAVKFYLPDSTTTDIVALSLPAFFARTPEDLLAFNDARRVEPETGQPDMERVGTYLAEHPEAMAAVTAAISASNSGELCDSHLQQSARVRFRERPRRSQVRSLPPCPRAGRGEPFR